MIFNKAELYKNVGESEQLMAEIITIFLQDVPKGYQRLKKTIEENNSQLVREIAHGIKGSAMSINAEDFAELAGQIEHAASESPNYLRQLEKKLDFEYNKLINELKKVLE